jgi:hypothetical protein
MAKRRFRTLFTLEVVSILQGLAVDAEAALSAPGDISQRLQELEQILSEAVVPTSAQRGDADPAGVHLDSVPLERIRRIASELQRQSPDAADDLDSVMARLLLNDYTASIAHLRAVARLAEQSVAAAGTSIHGARVLVQQDGAPAQNGARPQGTGDVTG